MLDLLLQPFVLLAAAAGLVLAGIHAYLGFHVVSRGVIFVDLSLAQAAAFGSVIALLVGMVPHSVPEYFVSLCFTLLGALIIAFSRTRDDRVPQEAFIGIVYAGFSALAVIFLSGLPEGMHELEHMLAGSLLTCSPTELVVIALLYSGVGLFHYLFRKQFFLISENRQRAIAEGHNVAMWDFLFYASFGVVVTSSVHIAGVLLVFSLLVIPPVSALLIVRTRSRRLIVGWILAFLATLVGLLASVELDKPTGPMIIASLIGMMLTAALYSRIASRRTA
jgi:zinc/manganese transport system permease protein